MARFADTFYFVALLEERDQHHRRVREFAADDSDRLITTRWVLAEIANALAGSSIRAAAARFLLEIEDDSTIQIVADSEGIYHRGLALNAARPDKAWSLTDCISFAVMEQAGLREALTGDRHFAQAGFVALFAD